MPSEETHERTPREEAVAQAISAVALIITVGLAPVVERIMSDPDIQYHLRWHLRRLYHVLELRLHELGTTIETVVGLWQIEQSLRQTWKESREHSS